MTITLLSSPSSSSSFSLGNTNKDEDLPSNASFHSSHCRKHRPAHSYDFLHSLFSSSPPPSSSYCCCCFGFVHADESPDLFQGTSLPFGDPASLDDNNNNNVVRSSIPRSKWKQFWRKLRAQTRKMHWLRRIEEQELHYDPLSYAMNFDDRTWMKDESHPSFTPRLIPNTLQPSSSSISVSISCKDSP